MTPTIVVEVPIIWGGLMPFILGTWALLILYGLYRFITGLFPVN